MQRSLIVVVALLIFGWNAVTAQADSTSITMNTFMAKNPGGNASIANVSMWPNPARGSVNVYINSIRPGDRGQCVLYNMAGKPCVINNLQNGNNKIYFNSLPEGVYMVHIKLYNDILFSKKLMIGR